MAPPTLPQKNLKINTWNLQWITQILAVGWRTGVSFLAWAETGVRQHFYTDF